MSENVRFERSSGNVFKDIGFPEAEAERELLKADLAVEIYRILAERKLTQAKAGELLGVDQADVSRLKNGDFDRFSVERPVCISESAQSQCRDSHYASGRRGGTPAGCRSVATNRRNKT